jgi:hypothetical protein
MSIWCLSLDFYSKHPSLREVEGSEWKSPFIIFLLTMEHSCPRYKDKFKNSSRHCHANREESHKSR